MGAFPFVEEAEIHRLTVPQPYRLFRLVPPSGNEAPISAVQASLQNLLGPEPLSLEICIQGGGRKEYFLRLPGTLRAEGILPYLRGAYPQVAWQEVSEDPACLSDEEDLGQAEMVQRHDPALPLRTETETRGLQVSDQLQGLLHLGDALGPGERVLCQLVARSGSERRVRRYQRIVQAKTDPQQRETRAIGAQIVTYLVWIVMISALLLGVLFAFLRHSYLASAISVCLGLALSAGLAKLLRLIDIPSDLSPDQISEKILYPCYDCQARLTAYGREQDPESILTTAAAAYGQFGLGSANRLVAKAACFDPRQPTLQSKNLSWLNSLEIATLWHFPQETAEVSGLARTRAPAFLPSGSDSFNGSSGYYLGKTDHPEGQRQVLLPGEVLGEHIGVYGASGMGKSNMLRLLGRWVLESGGQLIVIDPHGTLADYLAGAVLHGARQRTIYLVAGEASHPFGINMIVADADRAVECAEMAVYLDQQAIDRSIDTILATMERARIEAWGLRMRTIAAYGVKLMAEVGRATGFRYTILDLETLVTDPNFLRHLLGVYRNMGQDPGVIGFWHDAWMKAAESQRREWALPIINRMNLFKSGVMGNIVGSRKTTVDFDAILQNGANLIVNADTGSQENTRVLMGVILDLVNLAVRRRPKSDGPRIYIMLDEFQMLSIGNLQGLLNELRKWGVRFILGTQGLGALPDPAVARVILNNIQQIFAFACGPQERETVVELLDGAVDERAVSWLDSYHCYARLRLGGRVQPVFSFRSAEALPSEGATREEVLFASRARCCREVAEVIAERRALGKKYTMARFDRSRIADAKDASNSQTQDKPPEEKSMPALAETGATAAAEASMQGKGGSTNRRRRGQKAPSPAQGRLLGPAEGPANGEAP